MLRVIPDDWQPELGLPPSREACKDGPRPCRYVECPRHLWVVDGHDRAGRRINGRTPPTVVRAWSSWSCEADVSEQIAAGRRFTVRELGEMMGASARTFRGWVRKALRKLAEQPEAHKLLEEMKAA